jgi:16S rRNA (cytosine967-C5)-methyltransferase
MTPAARVQAAIEVLDAWRAGAALEQALTNWARASRFAGSKDRAAVRDHVFDAVRAARSCSALGGAEDGRGLMLGALRAAEADIAALFSGQGHAPAPLTPDEAAHLRAPVAFSPAEDADCPDWLAPALADSLGSDFAAVMACLRGRAPVFLRASRRRGGRDAALRALAAEGIGARAHPAAPDAIEVTENARKVQGSAAYADGRVELQDAASQAVVAALPLRDGMRVLDYCAGGGGKTLALGDLADVSLFAHDISARRLADLPRRAARAGLSVTLLDGPACTRAAPFDMVLVDAPCSGSGAWRRSPEGKWRLTPARLADLQAMQAEILCAAAALVAPGGVLAYATCSMLRGENDARVDAFLAQDLAWSEALRRRWSPLEGGDGFFLSVLQKTVAKRDAS